MMRRLPLALMVCFLGGGYSAHAQSGVTLTPTQHMWVHRIEESLAHTRTVQARFHQVTPDNGQASDGDVTLERPGHMRFSYDPPSPLLLVANQGKVVFQDRSIDQITTIPLQRTPLGLLMQPNPRFSGDVTITGFSQDRNMIQLKVIRTASPSEGELTLFFTASPLALQGWDLFDTQGHQTQIRLSNIKVGGSVKPELFTLPKAD
ncbi:outer membrane lipoprotein carrier protein LolA [Saccharibacter sp. 17.LH.SD]|uniref:LolA family protein n=1 Tax=Saccharibacter sp. 17.LH.SD TaxID=2689393 RepID=UPI001369D81E|nr:outer membrane lipoprotein carrier protein LolA [Saccharibacter sp. 17.LH.SD]MXV44532.1 outer membrane lipoprotein carrier protein LolA [Saccharibacter sp. 17.LH.SD]